MRCDCVVSIERELACLCDDRIYTSSEVKMSNWHEIDALTLAAASSRRDQFLMEILQTQLPGVHFNVVDEEVEVEVGLSPTALSPDVLDAGSPRRLLDGARENHIVPGYQQTVREWDTDHAPLKILAQGSHGDPSTARSGEFEESFSVAADGVVGDISHSQCLEFLGTEGPNLLMGNLKDNDTICRKLLNIAENVNVLTPGNEALPWDVLNMSLWKASLGELIKEMKTVEEKCPSLLGNSGVYVLTTSPYSAFLRALAAEIADRRRS